MLEIRMRVGPKGQVVIPKVFRDAFKIGPGTEVTFSIESDKIVVRATRSDAADVFERVAKSGRTIGKFPPHAAYERELRRRHA
jgi:AbrB family looped-hinge helix DNA binding protein